MGESLGPFPFLIFVVLAGYLIGAIPVADRISRRNGIDIFNVGTRQAGASNVRKSVGNRSAALVLVGDFAKGTLSIFAARSLGIESPWILLPAIAVLIGHWSSVFSSFRGGDGLATLGGVTLALFGFYGLISAVIAGLVSLGGQKMPYTSLLSIVLGYITLATLSFAYYGETVLTFGAGGLAALVLARAMRSHMLRRCGDMWVDVVETDATAEGTGH